MTGTSRDRPVRGSWHRGRPQTTTPLQDVTYPPPRSQGRVLSYKERLEDDGARPTAPAPTPVTGRVRPVP